MPLDKHTWDEAIWAAGAAGEHPDWADVDWYATDDVGHVGFFTSAGAGPLPRALFQDLEAHRRLGAYLKALATRGKPELLLRYPNTTDWRRMAERGLFAFNYEYDRTPPDGYRLVARPHTPLLLPELEPWAQERLLAFPLYGERFADTPGRVVALSSRTLEWVTR